MNRTEVNLTQTPGNGNRTPVKSVEPFEVFELFFEHPGICCNKSLKS